jgi:hypothetical protein
MNGSTCYHDSTDSVLHVSHLLAENFVTKLLFAIVWALLVESCSVRTLLELHVLKLERPNYDDLFLDSKG